ncbi:hypothetical protein IFM89_003092, partial [Coptis chinensis]
KSVIIGNGFSSLAENQRIGLVRALGLSNHQSFYRVTRPRGGINDWLHWLPVSLHKKLDYVLRRIYGDSQFPFAVGKNKLVPLPFENGSGAGLSTFLEADAKQIARMARDTFEKWVSLNVDGYYNYFLTFHILHLILISNHNST